MHKRKPAPCMFIIKNEHGSFPITWSVYWLIVKECGKNRHMAHKLFWDARDKHNPILYIRKKIKNNWHTIDTVEMDYNKAGMEGWIEANIFHKKKEHKPAAKDRKAAPDSIGELLENIFKG